MRQALRYRLAALTTAIVAPLPLPAVTVYEDGDKPLKIGGHVQLQSAF